MKLKNLLRFLFFPLLLFYSCNLQFPDGGGTKSDSDTQGYLITTNGSLSSLSQNEIDAEYNTFFFLPSESRKIYLGGKLPSSHNDYNSIWLENPNIWNSRYDAPILPTRIVDYYGKPIIPSNIPFLGGDYNVTASVGNQSGGVYTSYRTKNLTFKVTSDGTARNWGLRVYQQQGYNELSITKDDIIKAFNNMHVYLNNYGNDRITNVNSNLNDEIFDLDYNPQRVDQIEGVIYAMKKVYPSINDVNEAINTYFQEHPNEGLLFFVKDYNPINFPPDKKWLGYTISGAYVNGINKQAPISFVFVQRIKDLFSDGVENQVIKYTTIHELGHLWCEGFTNDTHTLWHNGDNQNICLMKTDIGYPTPTQADEKILNNLVFCEGHLQRGMNVSWQLKQYSPFGEQTAQSNQIIFASNKNFKYLQNQDIDIEISCDKPEIIQGEYIDVLVKVFNKTNKSFAMGAPKHYLYDHNNDLTYTNHFGEGRVRVEIPANGSYYFLLDPQGYLMFKSKDFSTNTFPPGSYDYYLSLFIGGNEIKSNKINLSVKPVPDSLKSDFDKFKFVPGRFHTVEDYERLYEQHKGTYYEKEFLYNLLNTYSYMDAIKHKKNAMVFREKASKLYKEFILKYPNTSQAYYLFSKIMDNYKENNELISNILSNLKTNDPKSKLLETLTNRPEYMNKQIKPLLK